MEDLSASQWELLILVPVQISVSVSCWSLASGGRSGHLCMSVGEAVVEVASERSQEGLGGPHVPCSRVTEPQ